MDDDQTPNEATEEQRKGLRRQLAESLQLLLFHREGYEAYDLAPEVAAQIAATIEAKAYLFAARASELQLSTSFSHQYAREASSLLLAEADRLSTHAPRTATNSTASSSGGGTATSSSFPGGQEEEEGGGGLLGVDPRQLSLNEISGGLRSIATVPQQQPGGGRRQREAPWGWLIPGSRQLPYVVLKGAGVAIGRGKEALWAAGNVSATTTTTTTTTTHPVGTPATAPSSGAGASTNAGTTSSSSSGAGGAAGSHTPGLPPHHHHHHHQQQPPQQQQAAAASPLSLLAMGSDKRLAEALRGNLGFVEVADGRVSRLHCIIRLSWPGGQQGEEEGSGEEEEEEGGEPVVVLEDCSSNGTFFNGRRMQRGETVPLIDGDRISLVKSVAPLVEQYFVFRSGDPRDPEVVGSEEASWLNSANSAGVYSPVAHGLHSPALPSSATTTSIFRSATSRYTTAEQSTLDDLRCQICLHTLRCCVALEPCGHNFCATCLSHHLGQQLQGGVQLSCPFRCPPPERIIVNYAVRALVELLWSSGRVPPPPPPPRQPSAGSSSSSTAAGAAAAALARGVPGGSAFAAAAAAGGGGGGAGGASSSSSSPAGSSRMPSAALPGRRGVRGGADSSPATPTAPVGVAAGGGEGGNSSSSPQGSPGQQQPRPQQQQAQVDGTSGRQQQQEQSRADSLARQLSGLSSNGGVRSLVARTASPVPPDMSRLDSGGTGDGGGGGNGGGGDFFTQGMSLLCPLDDEHLPMEAANLKNKQVEVALSQLKDTSADASVHVVALEALARLAWSDDGVRDAVASAGGIKALVQVMQQHAEHDGIQCNGCLALMSLVRGEGEVCQSNQWHIAKAGAIEVMAAAMRRFRESAMVQLSVLLCCIPLCLENAMMQAHITREALPDIIAALDEHGDEVDIQTKGMVLLGVLIQGEDAVHDAIRQRELEVNVPQRVKSALLQFGAINDDVLWAALFVLAILVRESSTLYSRTTHAIAAAHVVSVLKDTVSAYKERQVSEAREADEMILSASEYLINTLTPIEGRMRQRQLVLLAAIIVVGAGAVWAVRRWVVGGSGVGGQQAPSSGMEG